MNKTLRKAIYLKKTYLHKFQKLKSHENWEIYRKQRNLVNKLKHKSANQYFQERCIGGVKNSDFWKTIKPFLSNKSSTELPKIILHENNKITTKVFCLLRDFDFNYARITYGQIPRVQCIY